MLIPKVEQRIRQYLAFLDACKYTKISDLAFETLETKVLLRSPPEKGAWEPISLPHRYGKDWTTFWFRSRFLLPSEAAGEEVFLRATPNADTLVYVDGNPLAALNPMHEKFRLAASGEAGRSYTVDLESYAGHTYAGMHPLQAPVVLLTLSHSIPEQPNVFRGGELLIKNLPVYSLYYDSFTLFELARQLDDDSLRKNRILRDLYGALMGVHLNARGNQLAEQAAQAAKAIAPLLAARNGDTMPEVFLVGHAHIDHAWLWPISETERKAARTFANMTRLAEEFPEFLFLQSQPAQLDAVARLYPKVFEAVKSAYARGQWEPNGGMWIEADCNLTSGESLIRQFLVGKQATRRLLGYEGDVLWLPDVFGYAAALPQILAGCEIDYFVTSKINWNDTTRFPYDTFLWRGIDGTGVKTHYITPRLNGYNGKVSPAEIFDAWRQVQHKEVQSGLIMSIGEGDGGGGTMRADLECSRRLSNLEGAPLVRWAKVSDALRRIFETAGELPEWRGELYLELHRGTYTTQARTKRYNRTLELALRDCEFLYSALQLTGASLDYPRAQLLECWKKLLTNQFHDIIPGSSITRVYQDAEASYQEIKRTTDSLLAAGRAQLSEKLGGDLFVFNSLSWPRTSCAAIPWRDDFREPTELVSTAGSVPIQVGSTIDDAPEAIAFLHAPSMGVASYRRAPASRAQQSAFSLRGDSLETPFSRIMFDDRRRIRSLVDKESEREVVQTGEVLNRLQTAEDVPILWDAWDIESDWVRSIVDEDRLESSEVKSDGPLFLQMRNRFRIGEASSFVQDVRFYASDRRIDFITRVDWHESHRLLKAAFPINVQASQVRCEVQYGHALRSTTTNLPHDRARFELCAHKWISVEEAGFGAALLNDCKYGHDVRGAVMRITLLRSPKAPDPEADMGLHLFTYSLLPFSGAFSVERIVRSAYDLNVPLAVIHGPADRAGSAASQERSFFEIDCPEIIIEAVKPAETDDAQWGARGKSGRREARVPHLVVRLYEASGGARRARLRTSARIVEAWETNMLERDARASGHDEHSVALAFRPFEIKTLKLALES